MLEKKNMLIDTNLALQFLPCKESFLFVFSWCWLQGHLWRFYGEGGGSIGRGEVKAYLSTSERGACSTRAGYGGLVVLLSEGWAAHLASHP